MASAIDYSCCVLYGDYQQPKLPDIALPDNGLVHNEINILAEHKNTTTTTPQRVPFTTLPAEIRNTIYKLSLSSKADRLIIATPFRDDLMSLGTQPAITLVSRQTRSDVLQMFYNNATFVAYIQDFDFTSLTRWAAAVTSSPSPPKVTVEVKLLDRIRCAYDVLDLVRAWRDIEHHTIHLRIHNCWSQATSFAFAPWTPDFDQCAHVAKAIKLAEDLGKRNLLSEEQLLAECKAHFEHVERTLCCSGGIGASCRSIPAGYYQSNSPQDYNINPISW